MPRSHAFNPSPPPITPPVNGPLPNSLPLCPFSLSHTSQAPLSPRRLSLPSIEILLPFYLSLFPTTARPSRIHARVTARSPRRVRLPSSRSALTPHFFRFPPAKEERPVLLSTVRNAPLRLNCGVEHGGCRAGSRSRRPLVAS